jgi:hypothetical protein
MTPYQELNVTLESPGMRRILRVLRAYHKAQWREYRKCKTEVELAKVQTAQIMIDTVIPGIVEALMNAHIPEQERDRARKRGEWWHWREWYDREIKIRLTEVGGRLVCEQRELD